MNKAVARMQARLDQITSSTPITDTNKLLWERYHGPMQAAAAQLNAAIQNVQNILAGIIIEREGFSTETHLFDMDRLRIVKRPVEKGNDNGTMDE